MAAIGFDPKSRSHKQLTSTDFAMAGALSSFTTRATCQPLDVLKIRLQLQVGRCEYFIWRNQKKKLKHLSLAQTEAKSRAKYKNMLHATATIFKEEGVTSFWKGHMPAQYLSIAYGTAQFSSFEFLTKLSHRAGTWTTDPTFKPVTHFIVGGLAGVTGTLVSYPFDVVRTRLVAQGVTKVYGGTRDAVRQMMTTEGPPAFFRGIIPAFATIAPYSGFQFAFYTFFSQLLQPLITKFNEDLQETKITMTGSLSCGALAGLCAKVAVFPFDTTKKRLQVHGFQHGRAGLGHTPQYKGMIDCIRQILKSEGIRGLFKGLTPGLVKAVSTTSINFWFYEYFLLILALRHQSESDDKS